MLCLSAAPVHLGVWIAKKFTPESPTERFKTLPIHRWRNLKIGWLHRLLIHDRIQRFGNSDGQSQDGNITTQEWFEKAEDSSVGKSQNDLSGDRHLRRAHFGERIRQHQLHPITPVFTQKLTDPGSRKTSNLELQTASVAQTGVTKQTVIESH